MTNHLHVPTTQFKTNLIVIRFFSSIEERTASAHALLPDVLLSGTTNHPTRRSLQQACEALYDTRLRTSVMRIGKERVTQFSVEFLDESVAPESVTNEAIQLLKEVLYQPLLVNGQFDLSIVEREKRLMIEEMEASLENKTMVASKAFKEVMFEGEGYSVDVDGTLDGVQAITPALLMEVYQELFASNTLVVSVGATNPEAHLADLPLPSAPIELIDREVSKYKRPRYVMKPSRFLQASVMIGYRTPICFDDPLYYPMILVDSILGGSQASLLFEQVREQRSLAYSVHSSYQGAKGVMLVSAGVDPGNVVEAANVSIEQVERMQRGEFSDELFESAKRLWAQEIETVFDTNSGTALKTIHDWSLNRSLNVAETIEKMNQVTRQDVVDAAKTLELDTVFAYSPKEVVWTNES
jgi:predicted Zn-dependent peptidase